ncbi:Acetyltransferase (GNAT) family protein [compost metagenome]
MKLWFNQYLISDDKSLLDFTAIKGFLAQSYWGNHRSEDTVTRSIQHSLCYGVYDNSKQIGFARVVTDFATMYWLCDVFIDEAYRGQGIGKRLVEAIITSDELKGIMGVLGTKDAHELYEQYGFTRDQERIMRRK